MKLGLGGTVIVLILSLVFGKDLTSVLDGGGAPVSSEQPVPGAPVQSSAAEDRTESGILVAGTAVPAQRTAGTPVGTVVVADHARAGIDRSIRR